MSAKVKLLRLYNKITEEAYQFFVDNPRVNCKILETDKYVLYLSEGGNDNEGIGKKSGQKQMETNI